ncbi:dTDP-4-dehydrorhamnose reductase [Niameybacter massiliensis]|uniref:dTDP-4-dehydrorhamnose reductase n=1 Tax=Holtiella tumoricola TaxID=3018743 RepID=A0AA42DPP2_9FIRM|nr:dTDP-4-dehydrorhamnose reductase [Holtiella tumoricola]MDA3733207.1 dTDP-4-dehydrorhamnose reductase [Holtiella tumoricola]
MRILLTGSNGQLGLALKEEFKKLGNVFEVISTDYDTLDITNLEQVEEKLTHEQVEVVINCAAHTAVDKCEEDIENAYKINAIGARNLAVVCEKLGAKLVQVSTDYVFSGEFNNVMVEDIAYEDVLSERIERAKLSRPWREDDGVAPQSIYGTSKLMGEELVRSLCHKYFIVRTAWLYGEGNNFVRTMLKLAETNTELSIVGDQFGNPTYAKDLAIAIVNLIQTEYYGTYHGTCEGTCSWYDFAKKIFEIKEIEIKLNKVTSEQFVRPAKRPFYSSLDNFMLKLNGLNTFRTWEEALEDYLDSEDR